MKTKIPKRQFDSLKRNFEKFIKDSTQIDISWDSEANCGEGFIQIPNTISLGNRELTNRFPFHLIPIQYVISCIVAGCHEQRHYQQQTQLFQQKQPSEIEKYMALRRMVCSYNEDFYLYPDNYRNMPHEIDAEKQGIQTTYQFLVKTLPTFSPQECELLLLNYIQNKLEKHQNNRTQYYISNKKYHSLTEVYQAFDEAMQRSLDTPYNYYNSENIETDKRKTAEIITNEQKIRNYIKTHDNITQRKTGRSFLNEQYCKLQTGPQCMKMLGSITNHIIPNCKEDIPILANMDLSPKNIIGISLPNNPEDINIQEIQQIRLKDDPYYKQLAEMEAKYNLSSNSQRCDRTTDLEQYEKLLETPSEKDESLDYSL